MASRVIGELVVKIKSDSAELNKTIDQAQTRFTNFSDQLGKIGNRMSLFVTAPLVLLGKSVIKSAADMEMLQTSFETMLGSADKAAKLVTDLKKMAASTPFTTPDLANASKMLLQYGVAVEDLIPNMKMLGDLASGDTQKFQSLALVFSQIKGLGRLTGQDLRQMINAGFNPLFVISQKTGESMASLNDKMSKGQITFEQVTEAMRIATSEGGKFYGGMEKGSKTLSGLLSTLQDDTMEMARSFVELFFPVLKDGIKTLSSIAQEIGRLDDGTKRMIVSIIAIAAATGPAIKMFQGLLNVFNFIKSHPVILTLSLIIGAITTLIALLPSAEKRHNDLKNASDDLNKSYTELNDLNNLLSDSTKKLTEEERKNYQGKKDLLAQNITYQLRDYVNKLLMAKDAQNNYNKEINKNKKELEDLNRLEKQNAEDSKRGIMVNNAIVLAQQETVTKNLVRLNNEREKEKDSYEEAIRVLIDYYKQGTITYKQLETLDKGIAREVSSRAYNESKITKDKVRETKKRTTEAINLEKEYTDKLRQETETRIEAINREEEEKLKIVGNDARARNAIIKYYEKEREKAITEVNENIAEARDAFNAMEREKLEERRRDYEKWGSLVINQAGNVFSQFGEALATGQNAWSAFAKAGVEAVAAVVDAIGQEFLARAAGILALSFIPPPIGLGPAGFGAAAGLGAAGIGASLAAGVIRGFASQIQLGTGGIVYPQAGGVNAVLAEKGVPEVVIPDQRPIWKEIGDRISANMGSNTYNTYNNTNMPGNMTLKIGDKDFYSELTYASQNGKFRIDPARGIAKR